MRISWISWKTGNGKPAVSAIIPIIPQEAVEPSDGTDFEADGAQGDLAGWMKMYFPAFPEYGRRT